MTGGDPEETMPFTHRPFDSVEPDNPFTSPSGPASQPSGPDYVTPPTAPPPMATPPYGPPFPDQPAYPPGWGAAVPFVGTQEHKGANQAMVLGIVAMICLGASLFCCITIPGLVCAPIAWVKGARAAREIDAAPGVYGNRGQAQAGVVMGIIGTIVGILVIVAAIVVTVILATWNWSLV